MSDFADFILRTAAHARAHGSACKCPYPSSPPTPKEKKMKTKQAASATTTSADGDLAKGIQTGALEPTPQMAQGLIARLIDREHRRASKLRKTAHRSLIGDAEARDINREIAVLKMQVFEHRRAAHPGHGQVAPGITRLPITGLHTLGDDRDVGGI